MAVSEVALGRETFTIRHLYGDSNVAENWLSFNVGHYYVGPPTVTAHAQRVATSHITPLSAAVASSDSAKYSYFKLRHKFGPTTLSLHMSQHLLDGLSSMEINNVVVIVGRSEARGSTDRQGEAQVDDPRTRFCFQL